MGNVCGNNTDASSVGKPEKKEAKAEGTKETRKKQDLTKNYENDEKPEPVQGSSQLEADVYT